MTVSAMILLYLSKTMSISNFFIDREAVASVTIITECFQVYLNANKVFPASTSSSENNPKQQTQNPK